MRRALFVSLSLLLPTLATHADAQVPIEWNANSGVFPDHRCPWTLFDVASPQGPVLGGGIMTLATSSDGQGLSYGQRGADFVVPSTWVMEGTLRVVSESNSGGVARGVGIYFKPADGEGNILMIGVDHMFLWSGCWVAGTPVSLDTDEAFHTYRVEVTGGVVDVYQDNVHKLTGSIIVDPCMGSKEIVWGDGTSFASAVSEWKSFSHNGSAAPCASAVPGSSPWSVAVLSMVLLIGAIGLVRSRTA